MVPILQHFSLNHTSIRKQLVNEHLQELDALAAGTIGALAQQQRMHQQHPHSRSLRLHPVLPEPSGFSEAAIAALKDEGINNARQLTRITKDEHEAYLETHRDRMTGMVTISSE